MAAPYAVVGDSFRADTPQIWSPTSVQGVSTTNAGTICIRTASGSRRPRRRSRPAACRTRSCSSSTSPTTCARSRRAPSNASGRAESLLCSRHVAIYSHRSHRSSVVGLADRGSRRPSMNAGASTRTWPSKRSSTRRFRLRCAHHRLRARWTTSVKFSVAAKNRRQRAASS